MGRPRKEITRKNFEKLCELQCTLSEIAAFFDCSEDTVERWCTEEYGQGFADIFAIKRGNGKIALRRKQWKLADTSATMAIWLGKQYLGQKDSSEVSITGKEGNAPRIEFVFTDTAMEIKDDETNNT